MTGISIFIEGVEAGIRGDDPRSCPHEKMTREHDEWDRGQRWGVGLMEIDSGADRRPKQDTNQ